MAIADVTVYAYRDGLSELVLLRLHHEVDKSRQTTCESTLFFPSSVGVAPNTRFLRDLVIT